MLWVIIGEDDVLRVSRYRYHAIDARGSSNGRRRNLDRLQGPPRSSTGSRPASGLHQNSATASTLRRFQETGWPYVQHRGGPRGFLKLIDDKTLAFADYRGNRQYISTGNLTANDRACLILMDYPNRARMKIYARVEIVALDERSGACGAGDGRRLQAWPERIYLPHLETFDWNCAQHIKPRFTEEEIDQAMQPIQSRLEALEAENAALKARLLDADSR